MPLRILASGQEVAVMPNCESPSADVLEIVPVRYVGAVFIQLVDGRMFATIGGVGLNTPGCIVVVTDDHRTALAGKKDKSA